MTLLTLRMKTWVKRMDCQKVQFRMQETRIILGLRFNAKLRLFYHSRNNLKYLEFNLFSSGL
jgi:hypothetical protein